MHSSRISTLNTYRFMSRKASRRMSQSNQVGTRQELRGDVWNTEIVQTEKQVRGAQSVVCGECCSGVEKEWRN